MPRPQTIIFDLDGTLIDSAPGILAAFASVLGSRGIAPQVPLNSGLIGPPLAETFMRLTGIDDVDALAGLIEDFKPSYDAAGVAATLAYPGIDALLADLQGAGKVLYIATNKRLRPTGRIVERLGWAPRFRAVHAIDMYPVRLPNKAALLSRLLHEHALAPTDCLYVGDKREDGEAAGAHGMPFIGVDWGYNDAAWPGGWETAASPAALARALL